MIGKIRPFKEDNSSKENLVGKAIVDPKGDIIATCVEVFEDEKKKKRMRLAITTAIGTQFIVEETIPLNAISKIGEVILLKKTFEIKPIPVEEIISFEISEEKMNTEKQLTQMIETSQHENKKETMKEQAKKKEEEEEEFRLSKEREEKKQEKKLTTHKPDVQTETNWQWKKKQAEQKPLVKAKEGGKRRAKETTTKTAKRLANIKEIFNEFLKAENEEKKQTKKLVLLKKILKSKNNRKTILKEIIKHFSSPEVATRMEVASILLEIINIDYASILPQFTELLKATYNEPDKEIEGKICHGLAQLAIKANSMLINHKVEQFFEDLLINRKFCQAISMSRIHNINLKIFMNNYDMQSLIAAKYIKQILSMKDATDVADNLKDLNAIIIVNALINYYKQNEWSAFINSPTIKKTFDEHFINTIETILRSFQEGNIKSLTEIIKPKLGLDFSKKIITNMIKHRIDDFLENISIVPLDVLTSFFNDEDNMTIQILFDLINKNEINAQIVFIEDKTYISTRNHF